MRLRFAFDPGKSRANLSKHGISFEEAITTFFDFNARAEPDPEHSDPGDERFINLGILTRGRLLFVVHNENNGLIRIISARIATPVQRKLYEEG